MEHSYLIYSVVFLASAVIFVPLFKRIGLNSVLGYLAAGAVIGPWGFGFVREPEAILDFAELGVVMLLFIIGLELKPQRLWIMRRLIFGLGAAQIVVTAVILSLLALSLGLGALPSTIVGFALALSSTAFALQIMAERRELATQYGRGSLSILLLQDLAVIPALALIPLLGPGQSESEINLPLSGVLILASLLGIVVGGQYVLRPMLRVIAVTQSNEIYTAAALLVVLGVAALMNFTGLSMGLGAFIAGLLLAESEYRHQIAADIEPFRGLLLGLFFLSVGMTVDFGLFWDELGTIMAGVAILVTVKSLLLSVIARAFGYRAKDALKVGLLLSQGGEFAFVLIAAAVRETIIDSHLASLVIAVVILSMVLTPLLLKLLDLSTTRGPTESDRVTEELRESENAQVIIAGFGRVGRIVGQILQQENIPFTALDRNPDQIDLSVRDGHKIYYGDAARADVLRAAGAHEAKVLVVAIDDPAASLRIVEAVKRLLPHLKVYARAHNQLTALDLIRSAADSAVLETLECGIQLANETLQALGWELADSSQSVETFRVANFEHLQEQQAARTEG